MKEEITSNQVLLDRLNQQVAKNLLYDIQNDTLTELYKNEFITTKLYISLKKELIWQIKCRCYSRLPIDRSGTMASFNHNACFNQRWLPEKTGFPCK
jgi:hypothetical protein